MIDISHSCIKVSLPTTYLVREEKKSNCLIVVVCSCYPLPTSAPCGQRKTSLAERINNSD